jgi:hypothetical protein
MTGKEKEDLTYISAHLSPTVEAVEQMPNYSLKGASYSVTPGPGLYTCAASVLGPPLNLLTGSRINDYKPEKRQTNSLLLEQFPNFLIFSFLILNFLIDKKQIQDGGCSGHLG